MNEIAQDYTNPEAASSAIIIYRRLENGWGFESNVADSLAPHVDKMKGLMRQFSNSWPSGHEDFEGSIVMTPIHPEIQFLMLPYLDVSQGRGGCGIRGITIPTVWVENYTINHTKFFETIPTLLDPNANIFQTLIATQCLVRVPMHLLGMSMHRGQLESTSGADSELSKQISRLIPSTNAHQIPVKSINLASGLSFAENLWNVFPTRMRMSTSIISPELPEIQIPGERIQVSLGMNLDQSGQNEPNILIEAALEMFGLDATHVWNFAEFKAKSVSGHITAEEWMETYLGLSPVIQQLHVVALCEGIDAAASTFYSHHTAGKTDNLSIWIDALKSHEALYEEKSKLGSDEFYRRRIEGTLPIVLSSQNPRNGERLFTEFVNGFVFADASMRNQQSALTLVKSLPELFQNESVNFNEWTNFWMQTPLLDLIFSSPSSQINDTRFLSNLLNSGDANLVNHVIQRALSGNRATWLSPLVNQIAGGTVHRNSIRIELGSFDAICQKLLSSNQLDLLAQLISSQRQLSSQIPTQWIVKQCESNPNLETQWNSMFTYIQTMIRLYHLDEKKLILGSLFQAMIGRFNSQIPEQILHSLSSLENGHFPDCESWVWRQYELNTLSWGELPSFKISSQQVKIRFIQHRRSQRSEAAFSPSLLPPTLDVLGCMVRRSKLYPFDSDDSENYKFDKHASKDSLIRPRKFGFTGLFVVIRMICALMFIDFSAFTIRTITQIANLLPFYSESWVFSHYSFINQIFVNLGFDLYLTSFWLPLFWPLTILSAILMFMAILGLWGDLRLYMNFRKWRNQ